ncbi:hypothetical protein [Advenella faeciporci]|nr:hypothetical protein [Advenella faeciporci]
MKNKLILLAVTALLAACASKGAYDGAPSVPADVPPPTNLMITQ